MRKYFCYILLSSALNSSAMLRAGDDADAVFLHPISSSSPSPRALSSNPVMDGGAAASSSQGASDPASSLGAPSSAGSDAGGLVLGPYGIGIVGFGNPSAGLPPLSSRGGGRLGFDLSPPSLPPSPLLPSEVKPSDDTCTPLAPLSPPGPAAAVSAPPHDGGLGSPPSRAPAGASPPGGGRVPKRRGSHSSEGDDKSSTHSSQRKKLRSGSVDGGAGGGGPPTGDQTHSEAAQAGTDGGSYFHVGASETSRTRIIAPWRSGAIAAPPVVVPPPPVPTSTATTTLRRIRGKPPEETIHQIEELYLALTDNGAQQVNAIHFRIAGALGVSHRLVADIVKKLRERRGLVQRRNKPISNK